MIKKITIIFSILFIGISLQNCSVKKKAKGPEDIINVVADSVEYLFVKNELKKTFGKIIHTPQPEEIFFLKRHPYSQLQKLKQLKNIIILAPLNSGSTTSKYIESITDSTVKKMILADSIFVINKYDLWAQNQLVMIITGPSMEKISENLKKKRKSLFYYFMKSSNERLAKGLYNTKFEQKKIEAEFLKNYGWTMYVQADYQVAMEKPEDNFVWLRRGVNADIERFVFVHWIENSSPDFLNPDSISKVRDQLTEKYYRTSDDSAYVVSYADHKRNTEVNFNDKYALMTQGLWKFSDESGGGPFISYSFYDVKTKRMYILDASILAPKYYKKAIIQQVDVLLHSFKTKAEIKPERQEELLEELE